MPRVRCYYTDCVFLEENYCSAVRIEINPDEGCLTYKVAASEEDWVEEEEWLDEEEAWEDDEWEEDDLWLDDDDLI